MMVIGMLAVSVSDRNKNILKNDMLLFYNKTKFDLQEKNSEVHSHRINQFLSMKSHLSKYQLLFKTYGLS